MKNEIVKKVKFENGVLTSDDTGLEKEDFISIIKSQMQRADYFEITETTEHNGDIINFEYNVKVLSHRQDRLM